MNSHNSYNTTSTRACLELPDQAALDRAGISLDLETGRVVMAAMSWLIACGTSTSRGLPYNLMKGLVDVCRQDVLRYGEVFPAPYPSLASDGWPAGRSALMRLGITSADIIELWKSTRHHADDAALPLRWVIEFFPADIWPAMATFISWGPAMARVRMEDAIVTMTEQTTTYDRRRRKAGSPIARNTIEPRISAVWKLMEVLVDLRTHVAASPHQSLDLSLLEAWTFKPRRVSASAAGAIDADQDNSGPPIEDCSRRLKELVHDYETAPRSANYMKLRRVILQALLCLFGTRADALRTSQVEDFLPEHGWPDGNRRPTLRVFPRKSWPAKKPHYLPLPDELARWIRAWIAINGYAVGQSNVPLFPTTKAKQGEAPQSLSQQAFYQTVAGQRNGPSRGSLALMPRDEDPYLGWHTHGYRRTAYQLAVRAAIQFKNNNPGALVHVRPEEFAAALAAHKLDTNVSAIYRSLDRQQLTQAVVPEMWKILWGDGTHRQGADIHQVRRAREQRDFHQLVVNALDADVRSLQAEADRLVAKVGNGSIASQTLVVSALLASQQATAKRDQRDQATARLQHAEDALRAALETQVPLDESLSDIEYEGMLADALGQLQPETAAQDVVLAATITIGDVAELWDKSVQAIRSWIRNGPPKHLPTPWFDDGWVVRTKKDRRLRVEAINQAALTQVQIEQLRLIRLRRAHQDANLFHPAANVTSKCEPATEEPHMSDSQTIGRQTADGLVDAWQTSGSSPPKDNDSTDDPGDTA